MDPQTPPTQDVTSTSLDPVQEPKSFFQKYKFTLLSVLIVAAIVIPVLLLSNSAWKKASQMAPSGVGNVAPTFAPLTTSNEDTTLQKTDVDIQTGLDQSSTDLQDEAQVDSSQDSTDGL